MSGGLTKIFAMMADEVAALRAESVEHNLILDDVVTDLRRLANGQTSLMAADNLQRKHEVRRERPWSQVPAGWEVLAPSGRWYLVMATKQDDDVSQRVTLRSEDGKQVDTVRLRLKTVTCRPHLGGPVDDALNAFGDAVQIIEDQIS
jgi:hypothetical protein